MCLTNQSNTSQDRNEEKKSCNGTFDICQPIALLSKKKKKKKELPVGINKKPFSGLIKCVGNGSQIKASTSK